MEKMRMLLRLRVLLMFILLNLTTHAVAAKDKTDPIPFNNPLIGSWALLSGEYLNNKNQWVNYQDLQLDAIKVISEKYFSFTTMKQESAGKSFWAAGTGKYQITNEHYIEFPSLNSFNVKEGESFKFSYQIVGNEWHTQRYEQGKLSEKEVWKKLD